MLRKKSGHALDRKNPLFLVPVVIAVFIAVAIATYFAWIKDADHRDFYPLWAGARTVLEGSNDLYSTEATRENQIRLYGSEIPSDRDQQGFAYPAYLIPILLPFAIIGDVEIATALWEAFTVVLIVATLYLLQRIHRRVSTIAILLLLGWFYTLLMIFQGQTTGLVLAALGVGYWLYWSDRPLMAGLLASVAFIKPELVLLPVAVLAIHSLSHRHYRFILGLVAGILSLLVMSMALIGWWVNEWIDALSRYANYAKSVWPVGFTWTLSPILALLIAGAIVALLVPLRRDLEGLFAASFAIQILLFPQTPIWGLAILCVPLITYWVRGSQAGVVAVWVLGWVLVLGSSLTDWWKYQIVIVASAVVVLSLTDAYLRSRNRATYSPGGGL